MMLLAHGRKIGLFLLPFLLWGAAAGAQTFRLSLRVLDAESREPLSYATVRLSPGNRGGATDVQGHYRQRLPAGSYQVRVQFVGYRSLEQEVRLDQDVHLDLLLETEATGLTTVEVSSRDASAELTRPVMGVERLTTRDLELLPAALGEVDVLRGLQTLPGVGSAGEASNGLSVRGGSIDQNLILLDHAPIFNPTHLFGLFSVFPPDGLGALDLYRGNVPARFGGRVASALDVRLRNPSSDHLVMNGGIGFVSSRLSVEAPLINDRLFVLAGVRAGYNDFWFDIVERLKNTRANFGDAHLKLRWRVQDLHTLIFSGFYSQDYYQIDLISRFAGVTADRNGYDYRTLNGSLEWQYTPSERNNWQTVLVSADFEPRIRFPEVNSDNEVIFRSRIRNQSLRSRLNHRPGDDHRLLGGVQLDRYAILPGALEPNRSTTVNAVLLPQELAYEAAVFAEDEWSPGERLVVSLGLRYAHYFQMGPRAVRTYAGTGPPDESTVTDQQFFSSGKVIQTYGGLEPRLGLSYRLNERFSVKAAYGLMRQYLQNIYNSTTPLPTSRWKTADPHVRPQESQLLSAGLFLGLGEAYSLNLEGYYRYTTDILEYRPGADFFLREFVETDLLQGQGRAYGFELSLEKHLGASTGSVNYSYARGLNRVQGDNFNTRINDGDWYANYFDRPHTLNVVYSIGGHAHNSISFNFTAQSGRPYSIPNGAVTYNNLVVPLFLERNNSRLPVYHRLDFSWRIHNPGMKERRWVGDWIFTVYNLYGRKNAYNIYYGPRDRSSPSNVFGNSLLGSYRLSIFGSPVVSLTYQFKFS